MSELHPQPVAKVFAWPRPAQRPRIHADIPPVPAPDLWHGVSMFERGWLSSNNLLLHGGGTGAVLVDTGHCLHADQTLALVQQALETEAAREGRPPERLAAVINTHLHSDHCGGNAHLQRAYAGLPVFVPSPSWDAVQAWDEARLSYRPTAQRMQRFTAAGTVTPGEALAVGDRQWQVLAAPGHDPESVMLFDAEQGVLVSADALWENGFGVVFPELDGVDAFEAVGATLDLIATLPVRWVVPGHGPVFSDVAGALSRARGRLKALQADPVRHLRHAAKVLVKYHLLEEQRQTLAALQLWAGGAPLLRTIWERLDKPGGSLHGWCDGLVDELVAAGAAAREDRWVVNR